MTERDYYLWLASISNIEVPIKHKLINCFKTPYEVYNVSRNVLEKYGYEAVTIDKIIDAKKIDVSYIKEEMYNQDIKFISYNDNDYPEKFRNIYNPPLGVFYKGKLQCDKPSVAIIGARTCSEYGKEITRQFAKKLAENDITVISGLAIGIDGHAHEGALAGNGYTIGLLGNSIDTVYPNYNIDLFEKMYESGCVMSEYYIGSPTLKTHFPERNRLISALSDLVLVVEARTKSGTMITVDRALEQGKDVFVIPGRIGDNLSEGCLKLAKQGASIATSYMDILDYLNNLYGNPLKIESEKDCQYTFLTDNLTTNNELLQNKHKITLEKNEIIVYALLSLTPTHINELIGRSELTYFQVIEAIGKLSIKNLINCVGAEYYVKKE